MTRRVISTGVSAPERRAFAGISQEIVSLPLSTVAIADERLIEARDSAG
jgi:hypothetical protein